MKLVIFDCDGVLVDSEGLAAEIFSQTLAQVGIQLSAEQCFATFKGKSLDACFAFLREAGHYLPQNFKALLDERTQQGFAQQLTPVDGVEAVLQFLLEQQVPICLASNGGREKIAHSLRITGLAKYFDHCFSVDDVSEGKPAPTLFLHAAASMGVEPEDCFVVEDSASGFLAAQRAGMTLLRYENPKFALPAQAATVDNVVEYGTSFISMHAVESYLRKVF